MHQNLNSWKAYLLFLPGILGFLIFEFSGTEAYKISYLAANILWVLNTLMVIGVQAYFAVSFNKATNKKSFLFNTNAILPVIFFTLYFIDTVYNWFSIHSDQTSNIIGPVKPHDFGLVNTIIIIFIVHAAINFFVINNQFVGRNIKTINDHILQAELKQAFLFPMKKLVRASLFIALGIFVFSFIHDMISLFLI